jgi:hypothetical protein
LLFCSDIELPSRDGGALIEGTDRGSSNRAAGETGILGGGVGGTGDVFFGLSVAGHEWEDGIRMEG